MRIAQTAPDVWTLRCEPGDYLCIVDRTGKRVTDYQMIPESMTLDFDVPDESGLYYVGIREHDSDNVWWWGNPTQDAFLFPLYRGTKLHLTFPPLPVSPAPETPRKRRPLWRRLLGVAA